MSLNAHKIQKPQTLTPQQKGWSAAFQARNEKASKMLRSYGIDTSMTIGQAIEKFQTANGFENRDQEEPPLTLEVIFNQDYYRNKNEGDISLYLATKQFAQLNEQSLRRKINNVAESRTNHGVKYYDQQIANTQLAIQSTKKPQRLFGAFNRAQRAALQKNIDEAIALKADDTLQDREAGHLFNTGLIQEAFWRAIKGGVPMWALSSAELKETPIAHMGIQFNAEAKTAGDVFNILPHNLMDAIRHDIETEIPAFEIAA